MMQVEYSQTRDLFIRPETFDDTIAAEVTTYKHLLPALGGTLLDVGGNIGVVARWWLKSGGTRVISVEPEPENADLLRQNLASFGVRATVIEAAAVNREAPVSMDLFITNGVNKGSHTLRPTRGREKITVRTVPLSALIETYEPDVVKIDIEGGEFTLIREILSLPLHVRRLAIEYHVLPKGTREKAVAIDASLRDSTRNWIPTRGKGISAGAWYVMRTYKR